MRRIRIKYVPREDITPSQQEDSIEGKAPKTEPEGPRYPSRDPREIEADIRREQTSRQYQWSIFSPMLSGWGFVSRMVAEEDARFTADPDDLKREIERVRTDMERRCLRMSQKSREIKEAEEALRRDIVNALKEVKGG